MIKSALIIVFIVNMLYMVSNKNTKCIEVTTKVSRDRLIISKELNLEIMQARVNWIQGINTEIDR